MKLASLYIILKDHDNDSLARALAMSQSRCIRKASAADNVELDAVILTEGRTYSSKSIVTFWLTKLIDIKVAKELRDAVQLLSPVISVKFVDETSPGTSCYVSFKLMEYINLFTHMISLYFSITTFTLQNLLFHRRRNQLQN